MKKPRLGKLLAKKMGRTIVRSPVQFLTMILILALASTLFSGLYSSHLAFGKRVDILNEKTNVADIWTTTFATNVEEDPMKEANEDFQRIKDAVGDAGKVEAQYHISARIHGLDSVLSLSDTAPTINTWRELETGKGGTYDPNNFFLFNYDYLGNTSAYGEKSEWVDNDGRPVDCAYEVDISSLKKRLNDNDLMNVLNQYKREPQDENIFNKNFLGLHAVPTGYVYTPDNILPAATSPSTFYMTRSFLLNNMKETIDKKFNLKKLAEDITTETDASKRQKMEKCLKIFSDPESEIINRYFTNNRFLTKLNNRNDTEKYRTKIENAFNAKSSEDRNLLTNINLDGTNAYKQLNTEKTQSLQLCFVFPPVFFLVAVLIVLTTFSQLVLKERGQIGTLKGLGVSNRVIHTYYLIFASLIGLFGIALGLIIGPLSLPIILDFKYNLLYTLPKVGYVFPTVVAIVMTAIVIALVLLVTYLVTRKEVSVLPVTSMRPKAIKISKRVKFANDKKQNKNTHALCFRMALRNIFCSSTRSIMVIIGVLGCATLLGCGFSIDDTINNGVGNDVSRFFNTDALINFSGADRQTLENEFGKLLDDNKITAWEAYGYLPGSCQKFGTIEKGYDTTIYSIDMSREPTNKFFDIGYTLKGTDVAITTKVAKELNLKQGETIRYTFLGKTYYGKIGKIVETFYISGIFVDGTTSQNPRVDQYPTCCYVRFNKSMDSKQIINEIKAIEGVAKVLDRAELTDTIKSVSSSISYITVTIKVFAILLAVVALYNLALLNFNENVRNIATMKVLGFDRREVAESLFFEIMILALLGTLIGMCFGYPLAILTLGINQVPMAEYMYAITFLSFFLTFIISTGVSTVVNIYLGLKTKKVKMVESLKSIE